MGVYHALVCDKKKEKYVLDGCEKDTDLLKNKAVMSAYMHLMMNDFENSYRIVSDALTEDESYYNYKEIQLLNNFDLIDEYDMKTIVGFLNDYYRINGMSHCCLVLNGEKWVKNEKRMGKK